MAVFSEVAGGGDGEVGWDFQLPPLLLFLLFVVFVCHIAYCPLTSSSSSLAF
jgi:hypothetical protein